MTIEELETLIYQIDIMLATPSELFTTPESE
jgi:hypothetical protein